MSRQCEADVKANAKPMSRRIVERCWIVFEWFWRSGWHEFVTTLNNILRQVPDNAKPMSIRMRSRCQYYSAKPMSNLTTLNIILHMISENAKPMSIRMRSRCQYNAKPMSRRMRSRCQDACEADVKATAKPTSRSHSHAHTPNGSTHAHKHLDAKWKHAVRYVLSMFALLTSPPSISLAQYSFTH